MKKQLSFLMLLAALIVPWVASAQSRTVEIGNWQGTTSSYLGGFYASAKYSWTQTLYLENEMGGAGYIQQITFDNRSTASITFDSVKIYLGKTSMTVHPTANVSTWVPMDSLTLVFRDTNWSVPAEVGDLTIVLDEPYYYDGQGTLALVISKANSGTTNSSVKLGYVSTSNMCKYTSGTAVSYCNFPTVSGTNNTYKINVRFGMTATEDEDYCPAVSNFHVAGRNSSSVTVAWDAVAGDTYEVGYTSALGTVDDITSHTVYVDSYTFDNLDEATPYKFYVRHICDIYESEWKQLSTNTLAPPQELPLTLDFEDDDDDVIWNTNNTGNGWYIDSLGTGRALFISNDQGLTNAYTVSSTQAISWAWVDVDLDDGGYRVVFDWKCKGEANFDYMRAFLIPASVELDNGYGLFNTTTSTLARNVVPQGWILLGSKHRDSLFYNLRDTWQHVEYECAASEGIYHLAFLWSNDASGGSQPPAAIDNLSMTEVECFGPLSYTIDTLNSTSSTVAMEFYHPTETSFMIVWRPQGRATFDTVDVTGDSYEFTGLSMGVGYEGYIYTLCSGDTSNSSLYFEFTTKCAALTVDDLPYSEDFEAYGSGSAYPINPCWNKDVVPIAGTISTNYPYPYSTNAINGSRSLYFYAYRYSTTTIYYNWMTLPVLDETLDVSDLMMEFSMKRSTSSGSSTSTYSSYLVVGVSSDITTESAFVPVDTIDLTYELSGTVRQVEVDFSSYTGTGKYIMFYAPVMNNGTTYDYNQFYVDDITLMEIPTCYRPTTVEAIDIASDEITLSWVPDSRTPNPTEWQIEYGPVGFSDEEAEVATATDPLITLSNLAAATNYEFRVSAVCGTTVSESRTYTVATLCEPLPLPFFEGFETTEGTSAIGTAGVVPVCWEAYSDGTSAGYVPHVVSGSGSYIYRRSGENALVMTSGSGETYGPNKYVVMPIMEAPLNIMELSFWMYTESSSYGTLTVGYLTSASDISTFVPIQEYPASTTTYRSGNGLQAATAGLEVVQDLSSLPDTAVCLAFRWYHNSTYYSCCIDDIKLDSLPTCGRAQSIAIGSLTHDEAVLVINDTNHVDNYLVKLVHVGDTGVIDSTEITINTETYTFSGLLPSSQYRVELVSDCGDGTFTRVHTLSFRTACEPVPVDSLPYYEDFESYASGAANPIDPCWNKYVVGGTTNYPYPYSTNAVEGTRSLYFCGYNSTSSSPYYSYAVLPAFDTTLNSLRVSFKLRRYGTVSDYYTTQMLVGVMSNPGDINTFDTLQVIDLISELGSTIHEFEVSLADYTGTGTRIAFYAPIPTIVGSNTYRYNYVYLDSVVVSELPDCQRPTDVTISDVTAHTATVSWIANADSYTVEYADNSDFDGAISVNAGADASVAINGLTSYTEYYVRVRGNCAGVLSDWSFPVTFRTQMDCGANAINIIDTIGDATGTSAYIFYTSSSTYPMGLSTHLFSASEMLAMGLQDTNYIHSIMLHTGSTGGTIRQAKIYMTETALSAIGSSYAADSISRGSMTLVYSGDIVMTANQWVEIVFDTPFLYTASRNLALCLSRDTAATAAVTFYYTTTSPDYVSYYAYKSSATASVSGSRTLYRPDIVFNVCTQIPACPRPADVTLMEGNDTSFTIAWQGNATGYEVMVSEAMVNPDTVTLPAEGVRLLQASGTQITVTGLDQQTTYYYYVRALCGNDQSNWSPEGVYTTACSPKALPYYEGFEAYSTGTTATIDPCWTKGTNSTTAYPYPNNAATYLMNGQRYLYFYAYNSSSTQYYSYAALPMFQDSVKNLSLAFNVKRYNSTSTNYTTRVVIGVMTNPDDISTFEPMDTLDLYNETPGSTYGYEYFFNNYTGEGQYIAICDAVPPLIGTSTTTYSYVYLDDVMVDRIPSCLRPTNVTVDNIGQHTATVHWTGTAANYEVEYGPVGFEHGQGTAVTCTGNSGNLTNLEVGTDYDVYVRALCSATDISEWSFVTGFTTVCGPKSLPFTIDFENEATGTTAPLPSCWLRYIYPATATYGYYPYVNTNATNAHSGTKYVYYYFTSGTSYPTNQMFITPEIDTVNFPMNTVEVIFWAKYGTNANSLIVGAIPNSTGFVPIDTIPLTTTQTEYIVSLANYTGYGNRIGFLGVRQGTATSYIYLDDITVEPISPCPRAYNLTAANATQNSVELGWDDTIGSTQWVLSYAQDNSDTWTEVTVNANPYTLTGLTPTTIYKYRVAPMCANGQQASWSRETKRFSTSQVPATMPYSYDFEDAAEWANWQTLSNNNAKWYRGNIVAGDSSNVMYLSADNGATHSWLRAQVTNSTAYRDIDFGATPHSYDLTFRFYGGGHDSLANDGVAVMLVDPAEIPVASNTYLESPWGHHPYFNARFDTTWGIHTAHLDGVSGVKRVAFYYFNNALSGTDHLVNIAPAIDDISVEMQACERPANVTVDSIGATTAMVHWVGDSTATYMIDYRPAGTTGTDLYVTATGNSGFITGMTANTTYNVWVKKICSESLSSSWSSNATFTTTLCQNAAIAAIGDENSTTAANGTPVNNFYKYTLTETIIDSTELTGITDITTIGYYYNYATDMTAKTNVDIWIQPTTKTEFTLAGSSAASTDAEPLNLATAVKVYHGPLNCSQGWNYFEFDVAYHYSGTGNLMIIVDDNSGAYNNSSYQFRTSATSQYKTFAFYHDTYNTDVNDIQSSTANKTRYQYRPVMKLIDCGPSTVCSAPEIAIDTIGETFATMSWAPNASGNFEVAIMQGQWNEPASGTPVADTTYTFTGLTASMMYSVGVRAICSSDNISDWTYTTFTTATHPCYMPTGVTVTDTTYDGGTISWTAGEEGQTQFEVHVYNTTYDSTYTVNNATSLELTGLYSGNTYNVQVRAICGSEYYSDWTGVVTLTPRTCDVPTNVNATAEGRAVTVSWQGTSNKYLVTYYNEFHTINDAQQVEVEGATTTTITVPEGGMDYNFAVQAYCGEALSTYSTVKTVSILGIGQVDNTKLSLFPNPASTTVTLNGIEGNATVTLVDMNGRESGQWNVEGGKLTIDLSGYAKGAYFVRITGERTSDIRKLIVK